MLDSNLQFYADIGAALFPLPAGSKIPGSKEFWEVDGRAGSFKHHCSRDPAQWERWRAERPEGCNFGLVAFASRLIVVDIDTSGGETGQVEAWQAWCDLCKSWGLKETVPPYCQSASGGWHILFKIPPDIDPKTLRQPDAIRGRINIRVVGYVVAAGSHFQGNLYQLYPDAAPYPAPQPLLDHCAPSKPREISDKIGTHDFGDVAKLYAWMAENGVIQTDDEWRSCGMAAKLSFGDAGFALWEIVAQKLWDEPIDGQNETRWRSFATEPTANAVTMDSIFKLAHNAGWKESVRSTHESIFPPSLVLEQAAKDAAKAAKKSNDDKQPSSAPVVGYDMSKLPLPQTVEDEDQTAADTLKAAHEKEFPTPPKGFLRFPATFGDDFVAPDYLIDGILQKRFCYALTAQTGVGKTTVAMRLAAHVATGTKLGNIDVERGTVLYFAGENPTDVEMRWFGLTQEMGLDPKTTDVVFIYGALHLSKTIDRIKTELIAAKTKLSFVVVDTAAAFFETDDEASPMQNRDHAMRIRGLCSLPGEPCVLVLCHPTKVAKDISEMIPRGGSGFVNEIDGNIGLARIEGGPLIAQQVHKFRGREFEPLSFALKTIGEHPRLIDSKGRSIPTVIAEPISASEVARREEHASNDEDKVLKVLCDNVGMKNSDITRAMGGWHHEKTRRTLKSLADQGLAAQVKDYWSSTSKGQKYVNTVMTAQPTETLAPLTPANLGSVPYPMPARSVTPPPMPPR